MSKQSYDQKLASIEAITEKSALSPNMPIDTALQEAEDLFIWCQPDKDPLTKAGLNWELVDDLPLRAGALRYVQSQWQKDYKSLEEAQKAWGLKSPEAYELRDTLLHHFYHAYRKMSDLLGRTRKIAEGSTHADMIQDLSDLAALGKANPQPLQAISFDLVQLDVAEILSEQMALLLAKANGKKLEDNKLRLQRDKAFTYLKEAVDEIRHHGQYVFWKNDQKLKGYISQYNKKHAARAARAAKEQAEAESDEKETTVEESVD